ncbi:IS3 family transposase [Flavobacterium crocinum]|uniref:IS3 family transposase n=1 Tax=Flavobacterium crocinum TaxID=2183896 RepID=A0A2S1YQK5_9FLAO|nr:IS3 family transposase [Flavobacterium crocinum]AWK06377.1 IS3 family transposase [Flavobacterium crocinum]
MDVKKKYQKFDRIFKENAVKISYEKNSVKAFAEELGIRGNLIWRWRKEYENFGHGSFRGVGYDRVHPDKKEVFDLEKNVKESELRFEILKKAASYLYRGNLILYHFIKENEQNYSILKMCEVLEVGYGRYHRWKKDGISEKQQQIALLKEDLKKIFFRFNKHYGRNKLTKELQSLGYVICMRQVSFYMRELGLRRIKKRKTKITTESGHNYYIAPNVLNRNFKVQAHSQAWASDITYLPTVEGFLYLTIIIDLYDRKIIGWNLGTRLDSKNTTLPTLRMAVAGRNAGKGLIFHSDRGVQYANRAFTRLLAEYKFTRSMSRKGCSCDNAISESFFSSLKRELREGNSRLLTRKQLQAEIFEFIENWYNVKRIHTALNYKTIEQFNEEYYLKGSL